MSDHRLPQLGRSVVGGLCLAVAASACSSSTTELSAEELTPPVSWSAEELQIIDVYTTFRRELTDATRTIDGDLGTIEDLASPRLGEALLDNIVGDRSVGNVIQGTYAFTPLSVSVASDDEAQILVCAWDQTYVINEGEQLSDLPEAPSTATVDMQLTEGRWLVNGIFEGEGQPCELVQ